MDPPAHQRSGNRGAVEPPPLPDLPASWLRLHCIDGLVGAPAGALMQCSYFAERIDRATPADCDSAGHCMVDMDRDSTKLMVLWLVHGRLPELTEEQANRLSQHATAKRMDALAAHLCPPERWYPPGRAWALRQERAFFDRLPERTKHGRENV